MRRRIDVDTSLFLCCVHAGIPTGHWFCANAQCAMGGVSGVTMHLHMLI